MGYEADSVLDDVQWQKCGQCGGSDSKAKILKEKRRNVTHVQYAASRCEALTALGARVTRKDYRRLFELRRPMW